MAVLSAIYIPALVVFVRAFGAARRNEVGTVGAALQLAVARLDAAVLRQQAGDLRTAIVEAAAAGDLAQLAEPSTSRQQARDDLDRLRRGALDPTEPGGCRPGRACPRHRPHLAHDGCSVDDVTAAPSPAASTVSSHVC